MFASQQGFKVTRATLKDQRQQYCISEDPHFDAMDSRTFKTVPPELNHVLLSSPVHHVLLVTFNNEQRMNALPVKASWELEALWKWFDADPILYFPRLSSKSNIKI